MRPTWLFAPAVALYVGTPPIAIAQSVRGRLADQRDGSSIPSAQVELLTPEGAVVVSGRTAEDGSYELQAPGPGPYRVRFYHPGYWALRSAPFALVQDGAAEVSATSSPLPHLEGFYRRRSMGFGTFLTWNELDRTRPRRISDLIPRLTGFICSYDDFGECRISTARSWMTDCPPLVFIDGLEVGTGYPIDELSPAWLVAVEAHNSPSPMPSELRVAGTTCGVIAFWTLR